MGILFVMDWTTSISHLEKADAACQEEPLPAATPRALETPVYHNIIMIVVIDHHLTHHHHELQCHFHLLLA